VVYYYFIIEERWTSLGGLLSLKRGAYFNNTDVRGGLCAFGEWGKRVFVEMVTRVMMGLPTRTKEKSAIGLLVFFAIIVSPNASVYADIPFGYNVQSGRVEVTGSSLDVPITAVSDLSLAFVLISSGTGYDNIDTNADVVQVRAYLQSTNNIRFERRSMSNSTQVSYQVIECLNNEFVVYRGQSSMTTAETSKTLSIGATVTPANCLAFVTADNDTSSLFYYHESMLTARVSSATNVTIQRNDSGSAAPNFNWVVVEFDTNKIGGIQHGSVTAEESIYSSPQTVTISPVDLDNSILIFQARTSQSGSVRTAWAGNFNLSTEIKFYQHSPASSADIEWYVIDFGDGSAQRGVLDESANSLWLTSDATLASVDTTKTMHFHSMTCGGTTYNYPRAMSTARFTLPTNLRIQRMRNGHSSYIEWQVLEMPNGVIDTTPPSPAQMTWATEPYATGTTSVSMEATTATDPSGVEYYFTCTAGGGHDSNWRDNPVYEDMGLTEGTLYTYTVKARDKSPNQNENVPSTPASARTLSTNTLIVAQSGGDYDNIQDAIDACPTGWTIGVENGFWGGTNNRDLDFGGKRITVRSLDGPENCIINCGGTSATPHRAFYFHCGEDANSIVEGFTIKNGYTKFHMTIPGMDDPHGGAIYCGAAGTGEPSSPTIRNCIITDNQAADDYGEAYGGAIFCLASAPSIIECNIIGNQANFGGGIWCGYPPDTEDPKPAPTISNCVISDNVAVCDDPVSYPTNGFGGGIYCYDSSIIIDNCTIIDNSALWGGGVCCEYSEDPQTAYPQLMIASSTISSNSAAYANPDPYDWGYATGGAIAMSPYCGGVISGCRIIGNWAVHYGGAIDCENTSSLEIANCIISGNLADSGNSSIASAGGAICCYGSSPRIVNCTISSNEAKDYGWQEYEDFGGGGGVFCWQDPGSAGPVGSKPTVKNCIFENNGRHAVHEYGDDSDPNLVCCLFNNNTDGDYYDWDQDATFTGADSINSIPDGFTGRKNRDGDPLFIMDDLTDPNAITGTWREDPVLLPGNRTMLYDNLGGFVPDGLVGRHINASVSFGGEPTQRRQAHITANTATTIEVIGDLTGYVSRLHNYKVTDYHIQKGSPCIDTGTIFGAPTTDIEGNPRPVDILGVEDVTEGNPNGDSSVNILDLILVVNNWLRDDCQELGSCDGCDLAPAGGDGIVDYADFSVISFNWLAETLADIGAYELQSAE